MLTLLVVLGAIIVTALAAIAWHLQQKVKQVEAEKAQQEAAYEAQKVEKRQSMNKSIQVLAQGVVEDQLTKTEGAIRISVLMEFLAVDDNTKEEFSAFYQLAEATAHIPILDKWKALPTKEKLRYDTERETLESKYGDFVVDAAKRVLGREF